jgi:hypothetical protein
MSAAAPRQPDSEARLGAITPNRGRRAAAAGAYSELSSAGHGIAGLRAGPVWTSSRTLAAPPREDATDRRFRSPPASGVDLPVLRRAPMARWPS